MKSTGIEVVVGGALAVVLVLAGIEAAPDILADRARADRAEKLVKDSYFGDLGNVYTFQSICSTGDIPVGRLLPVSLNEKPGSILVTGIDCSKPGHALVKLQAGLDDDGRSPVDLDVVSSYDVRPPASDFRTNFYKRALQGRFAR